MKNKTAGIRSYPKCDKHEDCFAFENGRCKCLNDTEFKRDCPFYKVRGSAKDNGRMWRGYYDED